ncbi:hypothetical protein GW7_19002 [Heterocephalus glaber]|uniref:Testis expressed 55 n=1 Tax=Heterocephalus glaber TaxID=10181 RepID=G5ARI3_HETGA|nr:hypothetical protein GW7_19002 [Heterocephalus glaber]
MDEPLEEALSVSMGHESTATLPTTNPTNNLEDDNQPKGKADDYTDHRVADQNIQIVHGQPKAISAQADHKVSEDTGYTIHDQFDQKSSEPTDGKTSSQADDVAHGQTDHRVSGLMDGTAEQVDRRLSSQPDRRASEQVGQRVSDQAQRKASEQIDHRGSSQADRRASEQGEHRLSRQAKGRASQQVDDTLSMPSDGGASGNDQQRISDQETSDQETSEQIDFRLFNLAVRTEKADPILSDQDEHRTAIKFDQVYNQATKLTEQQAVYQADSSADKFMVGRDAYSEEDQINNFIDTQADQENYPSSYKTLDQIEDRVFAQFRKQDKQDDYRIQPCKFEASQFLDQKPRLSETTESESPTTSQAFSLDGTRFTNNFPPKGHACCSKLPSILSKLDSNTTQEKTQATEIKPDDFSEFKQEKTFHTEKQTLKGRFPPIVYEDPYQASLQYMEEHDILQIFQQITENLVFENPEDPLHFMLCQV